jgi:hypothetical protein
LAMVGLDCGCGGATTTMTVNAGQAEYDLTSVSPRIIEILRVALPPSESDTNEVTLAFATQEDIEKADATWRSTTGQPYAYMRFGQGFNKLRLYPEPSSTYTAIADASAATFSGLYGGIIDLSGLTDSEFDTLYGGVIDAAYKYGSLRIDYVAQATTISSTDSMETTGGIPVPYQDAVIWYACARLCESDVPIAQRDKAQVYWAKYAAEIAKAKALTENNFQSKPVMTTATEWF